MAHEIIIDDHSNEFIAAFNQATEAALEAIGFAAESYAKQELGKEPQREDTGLLRNSITHAVGGKGAAISGYSASRPSRYTGELPEPGTYTGTAPEDGAGEKKVYIGTNVKYAIYVHEGTRKMKANRFLKKAVESHGKQYREILEAHLKNGG